MGEVADYFRARVNIGPCGKVWILILFRVKASTNSYFTFWKLTRPIWLFSNSAAFLKSPWAACKHRIDTRLWWHVNVTINYIGFDRIYRVSSHDLIVDIKFVIVAAPSSFFKFNFLNRLLFGRLGNLALLKYVCHIFVWSGKLLSIKELFFTPCLFKAFLFLEHQSRVFGFLSSEIDHWPLS
jgi:hypothetical protein